MPASPAFHALLSGTLKETYGELPKVALPGDDDLLLRFALHVLGIIKNRSIYRRDSVVIYPYEERSRLELMDASAFRSWAENHLVCYKERLDKEGNPYQVLRTMPKDIADGVLCCPDFWMGLREIEECNAVPLPVLDEDGEIKLLLEGYDEATKTLTFKL